MKLCFLSNYFNHHQKPFCDKMYSLFGKDFCFIATEEMSEERKQLGWATGEYVPYVLKQVEAAENCARAIDGADAVILGNAPLSLVEERLKQGKTVLKYSERLFKKGQSRVKWLPRTLKYHRTMGKYKSFYLLSAGAYAARDFVSHGVFKNKCYKWGYFPEVKKHDLSLLFEVKDPLKLLWCGRFIDWKHPDAAIRIAERLKTEGYTFSLDLMGTGEGEEKLKAYIAEKGLKDCVRLLGAMPPEQVRQKMEKTGVYLFTSDYREGWGAVLNEAMNSGCAVVASHAIGAAPYLLRDGDNGLIYENGNEDALYRKVKLLLKNPAKQRELGEQAYLTVANLWNGEIAAERLVEFIEEIKKQGSCNLFAEGPCSKAELIKNNWFKEA